MTDIHALNDFDRGIVEEFRANGGQVDRPPGGKLLLLHTKGARSGKPRLSPLAYHEIDGRVLIVGSYSGAPKDPAWVHNLRTNPQAHIEIGTDTHAVIAHELPRNERDTLFERITALYPILADYQAQTDRTFPLFELTHI
ncbi:nitroreductase family deazaflavin-dependent oxidoreductase [Nocardia terpenica]|uniref:Nitroreductase family deazaflavin-dependent oxidoreductase n=1 Tax=Nocardia terpenica TaxID=455432 RepID=A0A6G9ZGH7_9NOCA|nr:nitroreductase family deazaflavin-dependent oxidoreductase [Nocardia terpenica]QIS24552.1 nitroreductase family deazaflavin-dependent oxidoreductase [Nocardia terpenica]